MPQVTTGRHHRRLRPNKRMTRRRRPWLAALLSLAVPGLGHLYAGYPVAGILAYVAVVLSFGLMLAAWLLISSAPANILLGLAAFPTIFLAVPIHAGILAARQPATFELRPYNRWYVYLGIYVLLGVVLLPNVSKQRKRYGEAFRIPSGAMAPTLMIGDFLYVLKTPAARKEIEIGSVVVFESVEEPGLKVVKRVVGIPGDTLMMAGGTLRRNDQALTEAYVVHQNPTRSEDALQRAKMRAWQVDHTTGIARDSYSPDVQDWGPVVVPPDSFMALGDNRDASYDSRYYGFIPFDRVIGQPRVIYLSLERDTTAGSERGVRWSRIGQRVK
jgi:signal peptidase I